MYFSSRDCLYNGDHCVWEPLGEYMDCEMLWPTTTNTPTTTEEPGCCKGDSFKTNEKCNKLEGRDKCERSSSCHFISWGELHIDCIVEQTTTDDHRAAHRLHRGAD